jgi:hypothetical protein
VALTVPLEPLRTLIASLSEIHVTRVYWQGEPEKHIGPVVGKSGKITLNVPARAINGTLEPRRAYTATPSPSQTVEWGAHRILTISIRADNFSGHGKAFDTLESVRVGLELPDGRASLRAADLAFVDAPLIIPRDMVVDNRSVSSAIMDVRLAHMLSMSAVSEGWIDKVSSKSYPPGDPATAPTYELEFTKIP